MINQIDLNDYKQGIADLYNRRSQSYDDSEWHLQICHRLLEYSHIRSGQHILDIGTATGHLAWSGIVALPSPRQFENLLSQLSSAQLVQAKAEFEAELEALQTEQGIWDDLTTLYILGRKPETSIEESTK